MWHLGDSPQIRHLDSVAKSAALPHVVELAQAEMVARVCKHLLQRKLCAIIRRMLDFTLAASDTTSQAGAAVNAAATKHVAKSYVGRAWLACVQTQRARGFLTHGSATAPSHTSCDRAPGVDVVATGMRWYYRRRCRSPSFSSST